jgi:pimeloyl-ACP methyl ester carboxylesterase
LDNILDANQGDSGLLPQVEVNGVKINYIVEGDSPPALIFIHGLGEYLESWRNQIAFFSKDYRVVALDLRGHGKSAVPKKRIEIGDFAADVKSLIDSLGINNAYFCGLSMGALVVLHPPPPHPECFLGMILVAARHQFPPAQTGALEGMSMTILGEEVATFALAANAPEALRNEVAKMVAAANKSAYFQA